MGRGSFFTGGGGRHRRGGGAGPLPGAGAGSRGRGRGAGGGGTEESGPRPFAVLKGHLAAVWACVMHPDTQELYTGGADRQGLTPK